MTARKVSFAKAGSEGVRDDLAGAAWRVFGYFEIAYDEALEDTIVYALSRPPALAKAGEILWPGKPMQDENLKHLFAPLRDTKNLFLDFVGLARRGPLSRDKALEVMLEWITAHGVLGLKGLICPDEVPRQVAKDRERRESLKGFWHAVGRAVRCLDLYEATNARDNQATAVLKRHRIPGGTLRAKRECARVEAADIVGEHVSEDCYPIFYRTTKRISRATHGFEAHETVDFGQGWGFRSLLGAMYLQMMAYMEGGGGGRPCKRPGCYMPVSFESVGDSGPTNSSIRKRKTPSNKVFCGAACRVWWNQNLGNSKKAKQKRERERRKSDTT